jgi:outer membrane receptor protein involved in Fe transport
MKIGARYEYTNSNLGTETEKDIVDRHYGKLFPSVFITRKFDENNSVNLSFTKRITRPTFNDLAPFTYYADPNTLYTGNSALQPAYANVVKADYTFNKYFLSLTYTLENASIQAFQPKPIQLTTSKFCLHRISQT